MSYRLILVEVEDDAFAEHLDFDQECKQIDMCDEIEVIDWMTTSAQNEAEAMEYFKKLEG